MSAPVGLPMAPVVSAPAVAAITPERYRELAARVRLLSWLSLAAMSVEAWSPCSPGSSPARSR